MVAALLTLLVVSCIAQTPEPAPTLATAPTETTAEGTQTGEEPKAPSRAEPTPSTPDPAYTRLNAVVEPCIRFPGSTVDPCARRSNWEDYTPFIYQNIEVQVPVATIKEQLLHRIKWPFWATHFVVRATVIPGSTRCGWSERYSDHSHAFGGDTSTRDGKAYCYHDLAVNEYLHGDGPSKLTINVTTVRGDRKNSPCEEMCFNEIAHEVERRIAYEGVEWIVFLGGPRDLGTSAWKTFGYYDVQRRVDGENLVVSYWKQHLPVDVADVYSSELEWTLEEFRGVVSDAYNSFKALTGGRIGNVRDHLGRLPPFFAEDAGPNGFKDFITSTKLLDGTDVTPSPPPPIPGEGDPNPAGLTTNDIIATRVAGAQPLTHPRPRIRPRTLPLVRTRRAEHRRIVIVRTDQLQPYRHTTFAETAWH